MASTETGSSRIGRNCDEQAYKQFWVCTVCVCRALCRLGIGNAQLRASTWSLGHNQKPSCVQIPAEWLIPYTVQCTIEESSALFGAQRAASRYPAYLWRVLLGYGLRCTSSISSALLPSHHVLLGRTVSPASSGAAAPCPASEKRSLV